MRAGIRPKTNRFNLMRKMLNHIFIQKIKQRFSPIIDRHYLLSFGQESYPLFMGIWISILDYNNNQ